jgi:hypothetical protein
MVTAIAWPVGECWAGELGANARRAGAIDILSLTDPQAHRTEPA